MTPMPNAMPIALPNAVRPAMHVRTNERTKRNGVAEVVGKVQLPDAREIHGNKRPRRTRRPISTAKWRAVSERDGWNCVLLRMSRDALAAR